MSMHKSLAALLIVLGAGAALAESPKLGRPIAEADIGLSAGEPAGA